MWCLTVMLLVLGFASAEPQYNYFPRRRPINPTCPPITSVLYDTRINTRHDFQTVNQATTQFVTTTVFQPQVTTTTVFRTRTQTQVQVQSSLVTTTTFSFGDQVITQTVQDPGSLQTQFVTTTRTVQAVSILTSTQFVTNGVPVTVTTTQFQTINQPFTNFLTQTRFDTRVVTVPGPDVVQTRVQTVLFTSLIRNNDQDTTRFVTTTFVQTQVQTSFSQGQNVISTISVQSQQIITFTTFNTRFENGITTSEIVITSTNFITQTQFTDQGVSQLVTETQFIPNTIFTTVFRTDVQPVTQVQTITSTRFVTEGNLIRTVERIRTSIVQLPGPDRIVTRQVIRTKVRQQVIFNTVRREKPVVVTRTVQGGCNNSADYDYDYPLATPPLDPYY